MRKTVGTGHGAHSCQFFLENSNVSYLRILRCWVGRVYPRLYQKVLFLKHPGQVSNEL